MEKKFPIETRKYWDRACRIIPSYTYKIEGVHYTIGHMFIDHCEGTITVYFNPVTVKTDPMCIHCGTSMIVMYGACFDYDRFICGTRGCNYEIEMETSSEVPKDDEPTEK